VHRLLSNKGIDDAAPRPYVVGRRGGINVARDWTDFRRRPKSANSWIALVKHGSARTGNPWIFAHATMICGFRR
jgi:hypothetical protein